MQEGARRFLIGAALLLGACNPKEEAPPSPAANAPAEPMKSTAEPAKSAAASKEPSETKKPARIEACSMVLSGAVEKKIVGLVSLDPLTSPNSETSVTTDYWLTDSERASSQALMEKATGVKQRPGDASMLTLTLNCGNEEGSISFVTYKLERADLPQAPGKYAVFPNRAPPSDKKGFQVVISAKDDNLYDAVSGELSLTHFDQYHLSGSFHVEAQGTFGEKKHLSLSGKFNFPCESLVGDRCSRR